MEDEDEEEALALAPPLGVLEEMVGLHVLREALDHKHLVAKYGHLLRPSHVPKEADEARRLLLGSHADEAPNEAVANAQAHMGVVQSTLY